ncbi:hypothetical protein ACFSGI_08515 [Paenibacillus nicotianae]|uniref:Bulb-type lectin domain-containing protein n=1 Tax=Paenibacillus nicotianae TaxID=1526551 RepID=A0ABW4UXI0_9BACL
MKKVVRKTTLIVLAVFMLQLCLVSAAFAKNSLSPGETLAKDQKLTSTNGRFNLVMQSDGNLVLYRDGGISMWSTNTDGKRYRWQDPISGYVITRMPQALTFNASSIRVTDQFRDYTFWSANPQAWSNNYYQGKVPAGMVGEILVVQDDGNLVMYSSGGKGPMWASDTGGH